MSCFLFCSFFVVKCKGEKKEDCEVNCACKRKKNQKKRKKIHPKEMSKTSSKDCVSSQPKSALEAWQRIVPLDSARTNTDYQEEWKQENAFAGLARSRVPKNGFRPTDPTLQHPTSIKDQYSIQHLLQEIPDDADAASRTCVRMYDKKADSKTRKSWNGTCAKKTQNCYTVNPKTGLFESAEDAAQDAYSKERKPQVARGFCMDRFDVVKTNLRNRVRFEDELQRAYDEIDRLEKEKAKKEGLPQPQCT